MITLVNLAVGALIKLISGGFTIWMDYRRQRELAVLSADKEKILALQSGTDNADEMTRWTRRILALLLVGSWVFIMIWTVIHPEIEYKVLIGRNLSWVWEWLIPFPINEKGVIVISAGGLLWEFKTMVEILVGFYFTKIGK